MPENSESTESALYASSSDSTIVATAKVGDGSSWTIANGSRKLQIRNCCYRLFHEVGRGETTREHQSIYNSEVLLAEHNLQIWSSERTDRRQWETVRLLHFQTVLKDPGHSCEIFISVSSAVQWSS
jgi:hypothetical protein